MTSFTKKLGNFAVGFNRHLDDYLKATTTAEPRLTEAIHYSCFNGGKRIRPFLVVESARICGVSQGAEFLAAAIEMIHSYSLIHDDLPAMDNSDLRRGRPSLHRQYDEATAILAGDTLLTASFEVVARHSPFSPAVTVALIHSLARAAGGMGMCGGQMLDVLGESKRSEQITLMQRLKTGALIEFSSISGAIMAGEFDPSAARRKALTVLCRVPGTRLSKSPTIFWMQPATATITGKTAGQDARDGKVNFVTILGLDGARQKSRDLVSAAQTSLTIFGAEAEPLCQLADYTIARNH